MVGSKILKNARRKMGYDWFEGVGDDDSNNNANGNGNSDGNDDGDA